MYVNLSIRNGGVYFVGPDTDNVNELRARTFLAVAHSIDVLTMKSVYLHEDHKILVEMSIGNSETPDDVIQWAKTTPSNSGYIDITSAASWNAQSGKLYLIVDEDAPVSEILDRYFGTPHRWLEGRPPSVMADIAKAVQTKRVA